MKKVKADGEDPLLAPLDWRNTTTERMGSSPVQRLMGRRTRTLLPTHEKLLMQVGHSVTATKLARRKARQVWKNNRKSRPLEPLRCGQAIRMRLLGETGMDSRQVHSCSKESILRSGSMRKTLPTKPPTTETDTRNPSSDKPIGPLFP